LILPGDFEEITWKFGRTSNILRGFKSSGIFLNPGIILDEERGLITFIAARVDFFCSKWPYEGVSLPA
jgi:hypothetical protein